MLEAGEGLEVIEIGVPAEHVTEIDHDMDLPNGKGDPAREWQGQRFVHNDPAGAEWLPFRVPGFIARDTTISENTKGVAGVQVVRRGEGASCWTTHSADIHFTFVMRGSMLLEGEGKEPYRLERGDAFVIPPGMRTRYSEPSEDVELLEVTLPGDFATLTN